ncbi:MAG: hypothetical protein ACJAXZ_001036, partial [Akkermansiaceae bacterium]
EQVRQPLQEQIEKLKKLKKLNTGEEEELQKRGEELRVLYAAVATNAKAADLILKDPLAELQRLQEFEDSGGEFDPEEKVRSISQFFVNERVENLVELAETSRLDGRRNDRPNIFLAKEKPFLGFMISTQWYCRVFLIGLIFAFLVPAVCFLKLSLTRR